MKSENPKSGWKFTPLRRRNDPENTEPICIVVVDDEPYTADVFKILLRGRHGIDPLSFPAPDAAWPHLVSEAPDLLIIDDVMPGMKGDEAVRRLLKRNLNYPIILLWGYLEESVIRREFPDAPNIRHLPRPFTVDQVWEAMSHYFIPAEPEA